MALTPVNYLTQLDFKQDGALDQALAVPDIKLKIEHYQSTHHIIDVNDAMQKLTQVGQLLRLAYAGAKGFKSSTKIIEIKADYQTLLKDSLLATKVFASKSYEALTHHVMAFTIVTTEGADPHMTFPEALKSLAKCASLAQEMIVESDKLVAQSNELCRDSKEALLVATRDETDSTEKLEQVKATIAKTEERNARLKELTRDLFVHIEEEKANERKAAVEAKSASDRAFALAIIQSVSKAVAEPAADLATLYFGGAPMAVARRLAPTGANSGSDQGDKTEYKQELEKLKENLLKKLEEKRKAKNEEEKKGFDEEIGLLKIEIKELKEKIDQVPSVQSSSDPFARRAVELSRLEGEAAKRRASLQAEYREASAELQGSVTKLKSLKVNKNNLDRAIASLEVVVQTLAKVKTIFENTRLFWIGVKKHCEGLAENQKSIEDTADLGHEFVDLLTDEVKASGLNWLALADINRNALRAIKKVDSDYDAIFSDPPSAAEANQLVAALAGDLERSLKLEHVDT